MSEIVGGGREHAGAGAAFGRRRCRSRRLTWRDQGKSRAKLVVMLVVSVSVLGAACGNDGGDGNSGAAGPAASTTRLLEAAPAPDPVTPDGVAVAALKEIYTWRPAEEAQGTSLTRARKWLGPSLIRVLDTPPAEQAPKPTLQWSDWARAKVTVQAFTFASGERPPESADPNTEQYKIGIEQTVVHPDGRKESLPPSTVIATVVRTSDGWRLDAFR